MVLTKPASWNDFCPILGSVLPFIRIRQCGHADSVFDFDMEDGIPIPPNTPISTHPIQYRMINTTMDWSRLPWTNPSQNQSRWEVELRKETHWMLRTFRWKEPSIPTIEETKTYSGFHHTVHLSTHSNHSSVVALFLPREIIIDKDELRSISSFPPFLATDPSSSVELISEEAHPQILFLFLRQASVDVPIHLRYSRASTETIHHVAVPPAVVYTQISVRPCCYSLPRISGFLLRLSPWVPSRSQWVTSVIRSLSRWSPSQFSFSLLPFS